MSKSLCLSGRLCYKWTRLFQRSLKAVSPRTCPRMEDCRPRDLPSPYPASWGSWGPGWAKGQGAGCAHCPSWTLSLYCRCPIHCLHDRRVTRFWGKWELPGSSASTQLNPCLPMLLGTPGRGVSAGLALWAAPLRHPHPPWRGQPGTAAVESTSLCVSVHTF